MFALPLIATLISATLFFYGAYEVSYSQTLNLTWDVLAPEKTVLKTWVSGIAIAILGLFGAGLFGWLTFICM